MGHRILAVFPRRYATRVALFNDGEETLRSEILHDRSELDAFSRISDQWSHRLRALEELLTEWGADADDENIDAVVGPAALPSVTAHSPCGIYNVDAAFLARMKKEAGGEHYIDLGATLADSIARIRHSQAFAVLALSHEEFDPAAKISGLPQMPFGRMLHSLNIKDAVYQASEELGKPFEEMSVVVAYLGKSFSICSHAGGRVLDLANANEQGPFSPARSGGLPAAEVVRLAFSGLWSMNALCASATENGGMSGYLGTDDLAEADRMIEYGDPEAHTIFKSMAYQIAAEIAAQAVVLRGRPDAVILTGGATKDEILMEMLRSRIDWLTDCILTYRGEDELKFMASCALRVLKQREPLINLP